jgi:hypothetical protein
MDDLILDKRQCSLRQKACVACKFVLNKGAIRGCSATVAQAPETGAP